MMYRRVARPFVQALVQWHKRPLESTALLMVVLTAIGGPTVCILHCWLHEIRAAQQEHMGLHLHHGTDAVAAHLADDAGSAHESHRSPNEGDAPSALTIAVVLAAVLLPLLGFKRLRRPLAAGLAQSLSLPPPRRPPCLAISSI